MINSPVLVLNQSYEALNICQVRRAIVLIFQGKADMLENGLGFVHSANDIHPIPSVIKLAYMVKRPHPKRRLTRQGVFHRDHYTCQYCAKISHQLTIDHVVPRNQGGEHTWENIASACVPCNRHKAGRTPKQAGMKLIRQPSQLRSRIPFYIPRPYLESLVEWQKYLAY